jgi:hypothetical protein
MDGDIVVPFGPLQISAGAMPLREKKGDAASGTQLATLWFSCRFRFEVPNRVCCRWCRNFKSAARAASPSQIAREIRPSATIGTATNSLANVSKLGHLAAHCAFRQLALNVVKSRLPGANQARNHEAVVLDVIQGSIQGSIQGKRSADIMVDAVEKAATSRLARALWLLGLVTAFIGNMTPLYGVLYWQWDTFQLLMLYWMETVVLAFWTLMR